MSFSKARSILHKAWEDHVFTAAVASVSIEDRCILLETVGTVGRPQTSSVTQNTLFDLASLTKVMATTMAWILLASHDLRLLDAPLSRWLPSIPDDKREITPRRLLAHASGLPAWRPYYLMSDPPRTADSMVPMILNESLEYPTGKGSVYSDLGFILLARIIEVFSGQDFAKFCAENLFSPLGLHDDLLFNPNPTVSSVAWTSLDDAPGKVNDLNARALGGTAGHAGLFGTAHGVMTMCQQFMRSLTSSRGFFHQDTAIIFSKRSQIPPNSTRSLGFDTPSIEGSSSGRRFSVHSLGHTGFTGTSVWMDPERNIVVTLLTNRVIMGEADQRIKAIRPLFHDAVMAEILDT